MADYNKYAVIESANSDGLKIQDKRGTACAYGFYGFGVGALLSSGCIYGIGGLPGDAGLFGPGIMAGGFAQLFTGLWEIGLGNEIGGTIFACFGTYMISYSIMKIPALFAWTELYATPEQFNAFWGIYNFAWALACATWVPMQFGGTVCHFLLTILAIGNFLQFGLLGFVPESHLQGLKYSLATFLLCSGLLGLYMASSILYDKYNPLFKLPMGVITRWNAKDTPKNHTKRDSSTTSGKEYCQV